MVHDASATLFFGGVMTGDREAPTPVATSGYGFFNAFHDLNGTLDVDISFTGLSSPVTDAHIHCCGTDATSAGVAIDLGAFGFPLGGTSGSYSHLFDLEDISVYTQSFINETQALVPGATVSDIHYRLSQSMQRNFMSPGTGTAYANIHTQNFPSGEIRGNSQVVPEPTAIVLLLCTAVGVGALRRR
jgi:hypothetical protein